MGKNLWIDDLKIGDYFVSDTYEVTQEEIIEFASKYDPQYFHLDPEKAKDSFFKGLASSGWLTAGITMKLQVQSHPFAFHLIGIESKQEWPSPTRAGDILHIRTEIKGIKMSRSKPQQGIIDIETITRNQDGEIRQIMTNKLLGFKKPEA